MHNANRTPEWWTTCVVVGTGCALTAGTLRTWFSDRAWATMFLSPSSWESVVAWLTGQPLSGDEIALPYLPFLIAMVALSAAACLGGSMLAALRVQTLNPQPSTLNLFLRPWGCYGWLWWCALGLWEWLWIAAAASGLENVAALLSYSAPFWAAACLAGWLTTGHVLAEGLGLRAKGQSNVAATLQKPSLSLSPQPSALSLRIWLLVSVYTAVYVTLNWRLWFNLYIPHGDSAMYEEHLWNVLHGKGFRSYLDQGLFLGEHLQVVHLALLPLYVLWPSHLLLELCESTALALGAFPVAWMTQRHMESESFGLGAEGRSQVAANSEHPFLSLNPQLSALCPLCAAAAYLLYFPMQFLDIEIDLKTFRPEAFGIPILLLTLDQLDRRNRSGFLLGVLGCLTVKEDYALVLGPLGVWVACSAFAERFRRESRVENREPGTTMPPRRISDSRLSTLDFRLFFGGLGLAAFSVCYLWLATRVVMPWFRPGEEIHYARYFSRLGDTPEAIVRTVLMRPGFVAGELLNGHTWVYALSLLVPVAGLAVLSPGRLAVGLPLFGVLCLNELARDPRHHFHAPLVAIVFWATAAGLATAVRMAEGLRLRAVSQQPSSSSALTLGPQPSTLSRAASHALWISALCTGVLFSLGPLGLPFWDPGSNWHWRKLYGPTRRGVEFAKVAVQIPMTARVASTDFVHPRFTHYVRSYDYSGYLRKVSGYERRVPDDTDFIVIDTTHPYSRHHRPEDVPEFHDVDRWTLVPDVTDGYFIVLQRKPH